MRNRRSLANIKWRKRRNAAKISLTKQRGPANVLLAMALLATVFILVACSTAHAAPQIKIGGTSDDCEGYFSVFRDLFREKLGTDLLVNPSSSVQGMIDLDRGDIDVATTDVPLEKLLADLINAGYPVVPEEFQVQGIGTNAILVYMNKTNKVPELSQEQLRDIFTGTITNWKEVGGDNRDIVVVWSGSMPEKNRLFQKFVIGFRPITKNAKWAADQKEIVRYVATTPGAIGIASNVYKSAQTHSPKIPFVSANVVAITKGRPSKPLQDLLEEVKSFDN